MLPHTTDIHLRTPLRTLLLCVFVVAMATLASPIAQARDGYLPFLESLQAKQMRAQIGAAPNGMDEQLDGMNEVITVPVSVAVPENAESRLEAIAEKKSGPLSLAETQQDQVLEESLQQFGYDIFNRVATTFAPVAGIPVPADYRIGPGDNLVVQLYGKRNVEYNLVVTRDGNILIPEYGPVKVAGLSFDEAEELLVSGFERRVIGARAVVTMGDLRTIQVRVAGDVNQPGIYTIGGLTTMIDALLTTGGVAETGSLRNIQLVRGGKTVARLDMYRLLLQGHSESDMFLAHNDTLFVPPIGPVVYIAGEVQRPAIYELKGESSVGQVIDMAGGLLPTASLGESHIERIQPGGYRTLVDFPQEASMKTLRAYDMRNGDFIRVLPLEDELEGVVLLTGHVERPGGYQYRDGMRLSDLLPTVEALLPAADVDFALVRRTHPRTLRTSVIYVPLLRAIGSPGGDHDLPLQARDQVEVFNLAQQRADVLANLVEQLETQATDYDPARIISVNGAVRFTGQLPLAQNARLSQVLALAGGLRSGTDTHYGVIARPQFPSTRIETIPFSLAAAVNSPMSDADPEVRPGDRLYFFSEDGNREQVLEEELQRLRDQASYGDEERLVKVHGEVRHSGTYPLTGNMRASDLLCAAGGLSRKAYGLTGNLSRVRHDAAGNNTTEHTALDSETLLSICRLARESATDSSQRSAYQQAYRDDISNPVLGALDQLSFTEKAGWVEQATIELRGEVMLPGIYAIDRGETLCEVLQRAGGPTEDAYGFGARFSRVSVRDMQQQTIDELHDQLDDLMVELSLSHSFNNDEKFTQEWAGKQDYLKTIRSLKKAEPNGRMVIDLERVMRCRDRDALVLQDGDALTIPTRPDYVQVAGQVYVPTSHLYDEDRSIIDYVELSGGHTVLGKLKHTYVIQANGEVLNYKGSRASSKIARANVEPGARIFVPINVDRMNNTERAQTWVQTLVNSAILAGIVL